MFNCTGMTKKFLYSSLMIQESSNVILSNINISHCSGYGLLLKNAGGNVIVENCSFIQNNCSSHCKNGHGSGGLNIYVKSATSKSNCSAAKYTIKGCKFFRNSANLKNTKWTSFVNHGGGLFIFLSRGAVENLMEISNSNFVENEAQLGGGLYLVCRQGSYSNNITFYRNTFKRNIAAAGGGGMDVGFLTNTEADELSLLNNNIMFVECMITNNDGVFGGGAAIFMSTFSVPSESFQKKPNTIVFQSCRFEYNSANGGAAVDLNRARTNEFGSFFIVLIYFKNCSFIGNEAGKSTYHSSSGITQSGAFFTSNVPAWFEGENFFEKNVGTAIFVSETRISVNSAKMHFISNSGDKGGAILLVGDSLIHLSGKNHFIFKDNSASYGGGICAVSSHYTDSCFIDKQGQHANVFEFINNKATTGIAHHLFVSNLMPCKSGYGCDNLSAVLLEQCLANFSFSNSVSSGTSYATAPSQMSVQPRVTAAPGLSVTIKTALEDQFGTEIGKLYPLSASLQHASPVGIDRNHVIIRKNRMVLKGRPGEKFTLMIQTDDIVNIKVSTVVHLLECPPGFTFSTSTQKCECSENQFISHCGERQASLFQGHWIGYANSLNSTYFEFGNCDFRMCTFNKSNDRLGNSLLPQNPGDLERFVCSDYRQGVLCGSCIDGYTVYYHSPTYKCGKETEACSYGVVFYILSEILPVTVIFLIIIFFNIHLTSGSLYSFLFYAQSLDILNIGSFESIKFKGYVNTVINVYRIFYGVFNLDIFVADDLSFCLHKNANVLGLFLIQYFTMIYSLLLIAATILIFKVNVLFNCIKLCHGYSRSIKSSVVNGLTAFLVLCYFKCIELTFNIFVPAPIYVNGVNVRTVVLFNGDFKYLQREHLKYAIPAFICLVLVVLPPPVLLLSESILMALDRLCKFKRNSFTNRLHRIRFKMLPFLDSFQGCFRDNCRCFAGLYFAYRILLILSYVYTESISEIYITAEIVLFAIMVTHMLFRPFQTPWHNKLDILLLINSLTINFLTLNHHYRTILYHRKGYSDFFLFIQIFLMTLPPCYLIIYTCYKVSISLRDSLHQRQEKKQGSDQQGLIVHETQSNSDLHSSIKSNGN